ncbi:MAG: transketolase [Deltaproteobacteria bacterium]|nr:transketolase [Deltaproteobacteria bacterium]
MTEEISASQLPQFAANALRALAMDAVQKANSGHPGQPMGMADAASVVWNKFLKHNPSDPKWFDRDRFVLSGGHGSMLLYGLLHLSGYDLPMKELENFRQLNSKTPGHPEYGHTVGVEVTTGPLGQGVCNAVGFALAERMMAARFNKPGHEMISHYTYVLAGDGDMQEGISHEAGAMAGHLGLGRLIVLWDDNGITIDGHTDLSTSEDVLARFASYGWHTLSVDGHDQKALEEAIKKAQAETGKPTLIGCKTVIGYGAPTRAGTHKAHGEPLGEEEIKGARQKLGWSWPPFQVPAPVLDFWRQAKDRGQQANKAWADKLAAYQKAFPAEGAELARIARGEDPKDWKAGLDKLRDSWLKEPPTLATRASSGKVLEALVHNHPDMVGGSADLTPSNNTHPGKVEDVNKKNNYAGRYIRYGIREHGMGSVMNGLALHGGVVPYGGTFLVFSDYARPAVRLSALMGLRVVYVFTHDSIGVGEDGPTHQPVEHYAALRAIPNLAVFRPADALETLESWETAVTMTDTPSALLLTRQNLPPLPRLGKDGAAKGGYVVSEPPNGLPLKAVVMATGSEVHLAVAAQAELAKENIGVRVVSLPCWKLFEDQPQSYRDQVIPPGVTARVGVEAGISLGWDRYIGLKGRMVCMKGFGASAPGGKLFEHFGITAKAVVAAVKEQV